MKPPIIGRCLETFKLEMGIVITLYITHKLDAELTIRCFAHKS
jgi:hypothetical protein